MTCKGGIVLYPFIFSRLSKRYASYKINKQFKLDESIHDDIESNSLRPKKHPGVLKTPTVQLPSDLKHTIETVIGDTPMKQLINESAIFGRYLHSRQQPVEVSDRKQKKVSFTHEVKEKFGIDLTGLSEEERKHHEKVVNSQVHKLMTQRLYNWKSLDYSRHLGLVYLIGRAAPEYAVVFRVLKELQLRENFIPQTLFDFGSGVGTVLWAVQSIWGNEVSENFCVDLSVHMNELSEQIISKFAPDIRKRVYYRQFLPASYDRRYDLVVSSYSLLELPSAKSRQETILNLLNKAEKYLVLIEFGTKAGFKVLNEARDYILTLNEPDTQSHILAPCPHDSECPRISADHTPCNFLVSFCTFPGKEIIKKELFSYLIVKKGKRDSDDPQWPRIVRPVLLRSRHVICRMCTSQGGLEESTFSPAKSGKVTYKCAKASKWGDILPVTLKKSDDVPLPDESK